MEKREGIKRKLAFAAQIKFNCSRSAKLSETESVTFCRYILLIPVTYSAKQLSTKVNLIYSFPNFCFYAKILTKKGRNEGAASEKNINLFYV